MNSYDDSPAGNRWPTRPRLKGFDYTGAHAYHLVFNTALHARVLTGELADRVVSSVLRAAAATHLEVLVYTVMPDHVHLLVQGTDDSANAVRLVQRCKQGPGFWYRRETGNHLWLPSFYDRVVRRGDDASEIAAYILANPVRAGLVPSGDKWAYSGGTLAEEHLGRS